MGDADLDAEWLEADGLGGFASGTVGGARTRRYHALVLVATRPPTGRMVLVNGLEVWVDTPAGRFALSSQRYGPDVVHPDGASRIATFHTQPSPSWTYVLPDGTTIVAELVVRPGAAATIMRWRRSGSGPATLCVRPLLSGRDYHALHHENALLRFEAETDADVVRWHPYADVPGVVARSNGTYTHQPEWYRNFLYREEQRRGLDDREDLASPGIFAWDLAAGDAHLVLAADGHDAPVDVPAAIAGERDRRSAFPSRLHRSADAYIVRRGSGKTIVAGYPWFTDWGRDTFIALRGLCLATGRLADAHDILLPWADTVGLDHVSEVVDGSVPHTPGGCPFQAWSLGEMLRLEAGVLATRPHVAQVAHAAGTARS